MRNIAIYPKWRNVIWKYSQHCLWSYVHEISSNSIISSGQAPRQTRFLCFVPCPQIDLPSQHDHSFHDVSLKDIKNRWKSSFLVRNWTNGSKNDITTSKILFIMLSAHKYDHWLSRPRINKSYLCIFLPIKDVVSGMIVSVVVSVTVDWFVP